MLNLKLFIQGYYAGNGKMRNPLYLSGVSNDSTASDSITVELHNTTAPYTKIISAKGILHRDGTAVIVFPESIANQSYFVAVRQRNSLDTWSKNPVLFNNQVTILSLTGQ